MDVATSRPEDKVLPWMRKVTNLIWDTRYNNEEEHTRKELKIAKNAEERRQKAHRIDTYDPYGGGQVDDGTALRWMNEDHSEDEVVTDDEY